MLQVAFNFINSRVDAYRILKNKTIAHWINFSCYGLSVAAECWYFNFVWYKIIAICLQAFLSRQVTFDILLNLRRKLRWDYMSQDKPPKAWWDRQEYKIFGNNGRKIAIAYIVLWVISLITIIFLK